MRKVAAAAYILVAFWLAALSAHAAMVTGQGSFTAVLAQLGGALYTASGTMSITAPSLVIAGKSFKMHVVVEGYGSGAPHTLVAVFEVSVACGDKRVSVASFNLPLPTGKFLVERDLNVTVPNYCADETTYVELSVARLIKMAVGVPGVSQTPAKVLINVVYPGVPSITVEPSGLVLKPGETKPLEIRVKALKGDIVVRKVTVSSPPTVAVAVETGTPLYIRAGQTATITLVVRGVRVGSAVLNVTIYAQPSICPGCTRTYSVYIPVAVAPTPAASRASRLRWRAWRRR